MLQSQSEMLREDERFGTNSKRIASAVIALERLESFIKTLLFSLAEIDRLFVFSFNEISSTRARHAISQTRKKLSAAWMVFIRRCNQWNESESGDPLVKADFNKLIRNPVAFLLPWSANYTALGERRWIVSRLVACTNKLSFLLSSFALYSGDL